MMYIIFTDFIHSGRNLNRDKTHLTSQPKILNLYVNIHKLLFNELYRYWPFTNHTPYIIYIVSFILDIPDIPDILDTLFIPDIVDISDISLIYLISLISLVFLIFPYQHYFYRAHMPQHIFRLRLRCYKMSGHSLQTRCNPEDYQNMENALRKRLNNM